MNVHVDSFYDGNQEAVTALQLSVLEYVKTLKGMLGAAQAGGNTNNQNASGPVIKCDEDGFPVIPHPSVLNSCNKRQAGLLLGDYLKKHYSE